MNNKIIECKVYIVGNWIYDLFIYNAHFTFHYSYKLIIFLANIFSSPFQIQTIAYVKRKQPMEKEDIPLNIKILCSFVFSLSLFGSIKWFHFIKKFWLCHKSNMPDVDKVQIFGKWHYEDKCFNKNE